MSMVKILWSCNIRMGINPDNSECSFIAFIQIAEWGLTDEAISPKCNDTIRRMLFYNLIRSTYLSQNFLTIENTPFFRSNCACPFRNRNFH